jgi:hypothetical protein
MMVRPKKAATPKGQTANPQAVPYTFPAPIRGWVLNENITSPQPGGARILDNWYCTTTGIKVRSGAVKFATLGGAVKSLFTYSSGSTMKLFGATASSVYDISSPADPTTVPAPDIAGLSSGYFSTCQFGTAGGNFLVIANGTNSVRNFDGTTWTIPAMSGATPSTLSQVWAYAERLFFVQKGTMTAWYLPVSSIAGAASSISLAGVMNKGGSLLFGARWSIDAGDGLDDKCVFVSTEGEVAVYQGSDPSSASTWSLVGVYQMPRPMGKNAHIAAGGDLLIATEVGLIPISAAVNRDIAAMDQAAVSLPIAPFWQAKSAALAGTNWEMMKLPKIGVMLVSMPYSSVPAFPVVNLQTGAWSRFTGWDAQCMAYFDGNGYFGASDSAVYLANTTGSDAGANYTCVYLGQADAMGAYGATKTVTQARAVFSGSAYMQPQLRMLVNYSDSIGAPPSSPANYSADAWDDAIWDTTLWDATTGTTVTARWGAVGRTGFAIAPELQLTFGITPSPSVELVAIDAQYHVGATVE